LAASPGTHLSSLTELTSKLHKIISHMSQSAVFVKGNTFIWVTFWITFSLFENLSSIVIYALPALHLPETCSIMPLHTLDKICSRRRISPVRLDPFHALNPPISVGKVARV
jgi:hypothetical protein